MSFDLQFTRALFATRERIDNELSKLYLAHDSATTKRKRDMISRQINGLRMKWERVQDVIEMNHLQENQGC